MRNLSRFIPGEEIDAVSQWTFGAVDTEALQLAAQRKEARETSELLQAEVARREGHAQGFAEGFAQGKAHAIVEAQHKFNTFIETEAKATAQRFAGLFSTAQAQLMQSEQVIAKGVMDLALALARQVLRQELSVNPNVLQPVVREALGMLMADHKAVSVRLNPLDMEVFQEALKTEFNAIPLSLVADPAVQSGGCVVASAGTVVDGRLDARWRRAVASLGLDVPWEESP